MVDQMNRDEHVKQLIGILDDVFTFLMESSELKFFAEVGSMGNIGSQIKIIAAISLQITECAHFICAYAKDVGYCMYNVLVIFMRRC